MTVALTVGTSASGPGVAYTNYYSLNQLTQELQELALAGGGYTLIQGELVKVEPAKE
jgi:hypothetical protein